MATVTVPMDGDQSSPQLGRPASEETKLISGPTSAPSFVERSPPPQNWGSRAKPTLTEKVDTLKRESTNCCVFILGVIKVLFSTLFATVSLLIVMAIPISMLVIGSVYINDCPAEDMIPIYLIVAGAVGVAKNLCNLLDRYCHAHDEDQPPESFSKQNNLERLVNLFLFVWFIAGCVFIYRTKDSFHSDDPTDADYCNHTLYYFSFWITTSVFIIIGIGFVFSCLLPCCIWFCCRQ